MTQLLPYPSELQCEQRDVHFALLSAERPLQINQVSEAEKVSNTMTREGMCGEHRPGCVPDPAHPSPNSSCPCRQDTEEQSCSLVQAPQLEIADPISLSPSLPHKQAPHSQAEFSKGLGCNPWFLFLPEELLHELELLTVMTAAATLAPSLFLFPWISLMAARCTSSSSG